MKWIKHTDRDKFEKRQWTRLINSLSGAKSANLIGTVSKQGVTNLAMVSSVFHLGADPALLGMILRPHSNKSPRHTFLNIQETGAFTVNHVHEAIFKKAHQTSARYKPEESEFTTCGLTEAYKNDFPAPFVAESRVQLGVVPVEITEIKHNSTNLVIGKIEHIYIEPTCLREDGSLDLPRVGTIAVTGLDEYHHLSHIARLSYAKPDKVVEEID